MFNYLEENLQLIYNANEVNYIRPYKLEKGIVLFAIKMSNERIKLTQPKGLMSFPWNSIKELAKELGTNYFKNFAVIDCNYAINKTHLKKLNYANINEKEVSVYATFDNGQTIALFDVKKKYFNKKLKAEMEQKTQIKFENDKKEREF